MLTDVAILETVLEQHRLALGADLPGYRHHAYRVLNLCRRLAPASLDSEKIAIAAVFHDLGIWSDRTFDYLTPSANLAAAYLHQIGRASWTPEITGAILNHHKISPSVAVPRRTGHVDQDGSTGDSLVEPFRRADWIDITRRHCVVRRPAAVRAPAPGALAGCRLPLAAGPALAAAVS